MRYATVCSGAEAFGPAWHELGYEPVFHAEIEPHASAVLRYQYPTVPNYGDFTAIATPDGPQPVRPVQLLCGGTPCQTYSIAGLREGLDSYKGGLTLEFVKLAQRLGAKWLLWENVPGVLSSDGGRAFGTFLGTLAECGYGFAYRVLDLQHFGAPQRRKRVFLVAHSGGDWQSCAAVLFEPESLRGNPAPSRKAGQDVTGTLSSRTNAGGGLGTDFDCAGGLVAYDENQITSKTNRSNPEPGAVCHTLPAKATAPLITASADPKSKVWNVAFCDANGSRPDRPNGGMYVQEVDTHKTLTAGSPVETIIQGSPTGGGHPQCVMQPATLISTQMALRGELTSNSSREGVGIGNAGDPAFTLQANHGHAVQFGSSVRRLMPVECERLMGWADSWTRYGINAKGKQYELADGPRYRICGNGWGQPVVSWIAKRIKEVDSLTIY